MYTKEWMITIVTGLICIAIMTLGSQFSQMRQTEMKLNHDKWKVLKTENCK